MSIAGSAATCGGAVEGKVRALLQCRTGRPVTESFRAKSRPNRVRFGFWEARRTGGTSRLPRMRRSRDFACSRWKDSVTGLPLGRCTKRDRGRSEEGPAGALFASTGARAWSEPASGRTTAPEPLAPTLGVESGSASRRQAIGFTTASRFCAGAREGDVGEPIATPAPTPAGGQGFPGRTEESNAAGGTERKERRRAAPQPCRSATTSLGGRAAVKGAHTTRRRGACGHQVVASSSQTIAKAMVRLLFDRDCPH
jgi:hypothetical protein